ncbi:hypothetical protein FGO68_gene13490 [Halteria grandinella]|uniref:Uncharacterized protein n=1 Tax=Halteria grandinella TaxID=5974 RepID=A0A8J8TAE2_HALGN|nr:hypothetical protein FGO68_gene13490 [Halteria grandinella]
MKEGIELVQYFESSELSYFKEAYGLSEQVKEALRVAVGECQMYMEGNLKKLLDTSGTSSKKQAKRVRELLTVLDNATGGGEEFKRLLKTYVDARRSGPRFKSLSSSEPVTFSSTESTTRSSFTVGGAQAYERGDHPILAQVVELGRAIEDEYAIALQIFDSDEGIGGYSALSISVKVAEKLIIKLSQILQAVDQEIASITLPQVQKSSEEASPNFMPLLISLDILESLYECAPKSFMQLIKVKELPLKKGTESILVKTQQILYMVGKRCGMLNEEEEESGGAEQSMDEVDIQTPMAQVSLLVGLAGEVAQFPKTFRMVEFINRSVKESSKRFNFNDRLVEIVQVIEAKREAFKKKYALKFQFIIKNYGYMYSRLESQKTQALLGLITKDQDPSETLVAQLRQSLDFHIDQFSQFVWKDPRSLLKKMFNKNGALVPEFKEIGAEVNAKMDVIVRKEFKRYAIADEIGPGVKLMLKEQMIKCISGLYGRYLKACKPEGAYSMEDIEISVDKLLKL